jgi:hypothetical protein
VHHFAVKSQQVMRALFLVASSFATLWAQTSPVAIKAGCPVEVIQDLGLPCSLDEPCPIFLELSDIQAVGDRLVVSGNLHTGTTTLESILLVSDDIGKTWAEPHPRIPMAVLDRIQFHDFEAGWINGHLLQPIPKDAFFLITTDGGKTWRKRPLFGESRPGAIGLFWFDTRSHGLLLIERSASEDGMKHEMWESMTAGDSWNVRQVDSKPIPLSKPAQASGWRIRPDAKTQSHRIERQVGPKWESVSSFRVNAGECKPPPPPEPPPAVEPVEQPEEPPPAKPSGPKRPSGLKPKRTR